MPSQEESKQRGALYADSRLTVFLLSILVVIALGFVLHQLQVIFKPLLIAVFLSFVFEPMVDIFTKIKIPKFLAFIISLIIVFVVIDLLGMVIYANIAAFVDEFPKYQDKFNGLYTRIIGFLRIPHEEVQNYLENIKWTELWQKASLTRILGSTVGSFVNFLANLFLILLFTVYIVLGRTHFLMKLQRAFDEERTLKAYDVFININMGMQKYLVAKTLISLATGVVATIILLIFGIEFAFVWGLLTFVLNFIPNVGSIIATIPPVLVAFFQYGSVFPGVWVVLLLLANQMTMGNFVEPRVMGKSLNLSPLVVILSLIFWGFIWGPIGMILAVPISVTIQIICANIDSLRPISVFMGGGIES